MENEIEIEINSNAIAIKNFIKFKSNKISFSIRMYQYKDKFYYLYFSIISLKNIWYLIYYNDQYQYSNINKLIIL